MVCSCLGCCWPKSSEIAEGCNASTSLCSASVSPRPSYRPGIKAYEPIIASAKGSPILSISFSLLENGCNEKEPSCRHTGSEDVGSGHERCREELLCQRLCRAADEERPMVAKENAHLLQDLPSRSIAEEADSLLHRAMEALRTAALLRGGRCSDAIEAVSGLEAGEG